MGNFNSKIFFLIFFLILFFVFLNTTTQAGIGIYQRVFSCGDNICDVDYGENIDNCPEDCSFLPTPTPTPTPSPTITPSPTTLYAPPPPFGPILSPPLPTISFSPSISPFLSPSLSPAITSFSPVPTPTISPTISISPPPYLPTFIETPAYPPSVPPSIPPTVPSFLNFIKEVSSFSMNQIVSITKNIPPQISKTIVSTSKTIIYLAPIIYSSFSLLGLMPQAKTIGDLLFLPLRIFSLVFGVKKRYWGVVYDAVTKQPLDPVIVILKDEKGKKIKTQITDLYGRYSFLVQPGSYYLEVRKTNYKFPSKILKDKTRDEIYENLYHGQLIKVDKAQVLTFNIPMDPLAVDWNEIAKRKYLKFNYHLEIIKRQLPNFLFYLGFLLTIIFYLLSPTPFNRNLMIVYLFLVVLRILGFKPREYGFVLEKGKNKPIPFSMITVFFEGLEYPVKKIMADEAGRYHLLVEKGKYDIKISKKEAETIKDIAYIKKIPAPKGIIKKDFKI